MNTWPGPENSWDGVGAYFTWASLDGSSNAMLVLFTLVTAAICLGVIVAAARHESEVADNNK